MCLSHVLTNWSGPLFIWHPLEVGMTLYHTQIIPSQARGVNINSSDWLQTHWTTYFKTTWKPCIILLRLLHVSSFHCCLRHSNISFSHRFINSNFMHISQQVCNSRGLCTALHFSPFLHPSASTVPFPWMCLFPSISPVMPLFFTESPLMLPSNASPSTPAGHPLFCSPLPNIWHCCLNSVQMPIHTE